MQNTDAIEKELQKENVYRARVQDVLHKHRSLLTKNSTYMSDSHYESEQAVIERIVSNESTALFSGIVLGGTAFASLRFGPRYLVSVLGRKKRVTMPGKIDDVARESNSTFLKKVGDFTFEASISAWAVWWGYNKVSSQNGDSYKEISKIPLCAGRSCISDQVCHEWVDLVHNEIPSAFWRGLDDNFFLERSTSRLKDERKWRAVRDFADNCVKRHASEDLYRRENGLDPEKPVSLPTPVPVDILYSTSRKKV